MSKSAATIAALAVPASAISCMTGMTTMGMGKVGGATVTYDAVTASCQSMDCASASATVLGQTGSDISGAVLDSECAIMFTGFSASMGADMMGVATAMAGCSAAELSDLSNDNADDIKTALGSGLSAMEQAMGDSATVSFGGILMCTCSEDDCNAGCGGQMDRACPDGMTAGLDIAPDASYMQANAARTAGVAAAAAAFLAAFLF